MNVSIDDLKKLMAELKEESYSQDEHIKKNIHISLLLYVMVVRLLRNISI